MEIESSLLSNAGAVSWTKKKCVRNFTSLLLGIGIDIDLAIGCFLKIQHEPNSSVNTWHYFGDFLCCCVLGLMT